MRSDRHDAPERRVWNSLEICKLVASVATPLMILALGFLVWGLQQDLTRHWEQSRTENIRQAEADARERERIRDLRVSIYRDAAPLINEIVSYHFYVGRWKQRSPADIIETKRQLDSLIYSHRVLFTPEFISLYHDFMSQGFRSAGNYHGEPRIRTQAQCRHPTTRDTSEAWLRYFTHEDQRRALCQSHVKLLAGLSSELLLQSLNQSGSPESGKLSPCPPLYDREGCV